MIEGTTAIVVEGEVGDERGALLGVAAVLTPAGGSQ
jgi:hypothetical protein